MNTDTAHPRALSLWCVATFTAAGALSVLFALNGEHVALASLLLLGALCAFAEHIIVRLPNGSSVSAW